MINELKNRLKSLEGQMEYTIFALSHDLENWERKEYLTLKSEYEKEIKNENIRIELMKAA